jgi:cytochrome bd ubiquinol oxidase subunit I
VAVRADLDQPFLLRTGHHWTGIPDALLQTAWYRSGKPEYLRLTRFFGTRAMRVMAYAATLVVLLGLCGLWLIRRKTFTRSRWFLLAATWAVLLPFAMNTAGWLLTESGRQPWIVQGLKLTRNSASPSVSFTDLVIAMVAFGVLYTALAVLDVVLMLRYSRKQIDPAPAPIDDQARVPSMLY